MRPSMKSPAVILATWFGAGLMPKAPGTWGSLAALPCAWWLVKTYGIEGLLIGAVVVSVVGIWASNGYIRLSGDPDPGPVVIDEVAGQWIALMFVPQELVWYVAGFALFRFFDIIKPGPIGYLDKNVKGGLGVMLDDIFAGVFAAIILYVVQWGLHHYA